MRKLVESHLENLSSKNEFLFRVTCASCGTEYGNKPIRFSKANTRPATSDEQIIHDTLYEQESIAAMQTAISNASEHMNYCPICKRLVCDECFLICDDQDMCRQCAEELKLRGKPVLSSLRSSVLQLKKKVTRRSKRNGRLLLCLLINMLLDLEWSIPAWILLGLHFWLGMNIWWFVGALIIWILKILLSMWFVGWVANCGNLKDPPKENKNPYSVK